MTQKELEEKIAKLEKEVETLKNRQPLVIPTISCPLQHYPQNPWPPYPGYPTILCYKAENIVF